MSANKTNGSSSRQFLFAMWEGGGTIPPMLGVARRLIARGHRVRVLGDPTIRGEAELRRFRDLFIVNPAAAYAADTLEVLEREPVDVFVPDYVLFGAIMAAEKARVPTVALVPNIWPLLVRGAPPFGAGFLPAETRRLSWSAIVRSGMTGAPPTEVSMAAPAIPFDQDVNVATRRMQDLLERQRRAFLDQGPPSAEARIAQLDRLIASVIEHEKRIVDACASDFGHRSPDTSRWAEVGAIVEGAKYCKKHLRGWMKPEKRRSVFPLGLLGAKSEVRYQPLGVVGVVSPWNFPIYLALSPLAGVLAAGNRALIKPSEATPAASEVLADLIRKAFDETEVSVVTGGPAIGEAFTKLPFDHLVFTGGTSIARHVMRAAADNLVPLTLELGGKCPVVVGKGADMRDVAVKVMNAKCMNAGQICLAPDYVLVPAERQGELVDALKAAVGSMYDGLRDNPDYTSVINDRHRKRVQGYLDDARQKGGEVVELNPRGESFEGQPANKMPPSLVLNPTDEMAIMKEEVFGPAMPVKTYRNIDEAIGYVNAHDRPLALYYFGYDADERERVLSRTTSGGVTVNDIMMHIVQDDLPFGGVGPSGMGSYHAREGFKTFSHARSVFTQTKIDALGKMLRPPYGDRYRKFVGSMIKP